MIVITVCIRISIIGGVGGVGTEDGTRYETGVFPTVSDVPIHIAMRSYPVWSWDLPPVCWLGCGCCQWEWGREWWWIVVETKKRRKEGTVLWVY